MQRLGKFKMPGYDLQFALNAVAPLKRLDKPSARRYEAEIIEHGGAQIGRETTCRTDHVIYGVFHCAQAFGNRRVRGIKLVLQHLHVDLERRQRLSKLFVKLA